MVITYKFINDCTPLLRGTFTRYTTEKQTIKNTKLNKADRPERRYAFSCSARLLSMFVIYSYLAILPTSNTRCE